MRVFVNGEEAGLVGTQEDADLSLLRARKAVGKSAGDLVFMEVQMTTQPESILWGEFESPETATSRIVDILNRSPRQSVHSAYTVKIGTSTANLKNTAEVRSLLQAALNHYEEYQEFVVTLERDTAREFNVLKPIVMEASSVAKAKEEAMLPEAGVWAFLNSDEDIEVSAENKSFEDFELGLISMDFKENVEIVEASLSEDELDDLQEAIARITTLQEVPVIYKVVSGDTLSEIAMNTGIPMETLVEMNPDKLESVNSTLHVGDELTVTVPEPVLSVVWSSRRRYEEDYDEAVEYIPNDEWYTNQTKTLQEPHAGHREVVAVVSYTNNEQTSVSIEKEDVAMQAVAKVMERGTKIPPSYIRPVAGGRISSGFGGRKRPTKGASTYHRGVDFAVPTGTPVMASCGGTVIRAGWASGLGNSVTLSHPDGRTTVYGHLSKILVSTGQSVSQGQRIALSGNTGVSTGPHLHFGLTINGTYVNPLNYLQ